jgi:DNA-binding response OmpR family regulator
MSQETREATILLIERSGKHVVGFAAALERKGYRIEVAPTGHLALESVQVLRPSLIILNAASLGTSGRRICQSLIEHTHSIPIIHILPNTHPAIDEKRGLADVTLTMPFTSRKLVNRIRRLLPAGPEDTLQSGPIRLAMGTRIVQAYEREKRLTPKTARLLEVFVRNPGQTLDRSFLMRQVWNTDYVGDTRTLDVHIRWLREAIEADPSDPRHLVTVRGMGYRFEPHPDAKPGKRPAD